MNEERYAPHKLWVSQPATLPAGISGGLRLTPEEFIPYSFTFRIRKPDEEEDNEETDWVESVVRLVDSDGDVWMGRSMWSVEDFIDPIGSLGSLEGPAFESNCPEEWKRPFTDGVFFSGARGLMDDRFYRNLLIGDQILVIPMKHQGPKLDLAFYTDPGLDMLSVYARVSDLYGCASGDSEIDMVPPFIAGVEVTDRLFVNYFGRDSDGYWEQGLLPELVRFEKTGGGAVPNPLIRKAESVE